MRSVGKQFINHMLMSGQSQMYRCMQVANIDVSIDLYLIDQANRRAASNE